VSAQNLTKSYRSANDITWRESHSVMGITGDYISVIGLTVAYCIVIIKMQKSLNH